MADKDLLTVPDVATLAGVSEATVHRWKNLPENAGRLPMPDRRPGKPATWDRQVIDEWLATFNAVRNTERALEQFAECHELDTVLQSLARTGRRLLASTEIPLPLRKKLADTLGKVQWARGTEKLGVADQRRARLLLLQLLTLSGEVNER